MVVKNTKNARDYLDLTDSEYEQLSVLASEFSMSKLIYHTSVLESSLADLIRARESKRSVAEIALTRMCDARLGKGEESLLARLDELESTVSRLKFSSTASAPVREETQAMPAREVIHSDVNPVVQLEQDVTETAAQQRPYSGWGKVVAEIEIAKPSIYPTLAKAVALVEADGSFTVKVDAFFVKIIGENPDNRALLTGVIAQVEGKESSSITLRVIPKAANEVGTLADEIEKALKN